VDLLLTETTDAIALMSSVLGQPSAKVLIDLSVRRRGVLTQETWVEKTLRWAGRDLVTRIAGWMPKPHAEGAWLQRQIRYLPTISRLSAQGMILLYTYSELEFEEWSGRPEMMGTFGDIFPRKTIRTCQAAVNRPRFRQSVDFQKYLNRDQMIDFCRFLLKLEPPALQRATIFWNKLPASEQENLLKLGQFKTLCRSLAEKHYPDAFHLWTAETNHLDYFLTMDRKFPRALSSNRKLDCRCKAVSPEDLLNALGILDRDPYPYTDLRPRTYYE
jgi:hypothetical protein